MLQIILAIIVICIAFTIIKKVGGFALKILKSIFGLIYLVIAGPALLCTKIFYGLTKLLHIQSFAYYLLSICSLPSFIYLCAVHIPYSKKERFINCKSFFAPKKKTRNETIAMACFLTLEGLFFCALPSIVKIEEDSAYCLYLLGAIYVLGAFIYSLVKISKWKKENQAIYEHYTEWRKWTLKEVSEISEAEIEEKLIAASVNFAENDKNKNKFTIDEMPYGRATAFISYFGKNLDDEEPVYFSPKMSSDENELREYGTLVTTKSVYISEKGNEDIEIPYTGLWRITKDDNKIYFDYGLTYGELQIIEIDKGISNVNFDFFIEESEQFETISLALLQDKVKNALDEAFESYEESSVDNEQKQFDAKTRTADFSKAAELGGIGAGLAQNSKVYAAVKNNFDGKQGHGTAAEYANNAIDKLNPFNKAEHLGSDNALNGADRVVNGQLIQCKYCETGRKCINAAFDDNGNGEFRYNGMQIEVPHDKKIYDDAVNTMKEKISNGQVPGETNPENAKNYVRRGHITYLQAYNIAGSGSIESIALDATQGIICALPGAGITTVLTFAAAVWNGEDLKVAAKTSALAGLRVAGKSAAIYTLTMQLSRGKVVNPFYSILKNNSVKKYGTNYVAKGANKIAKKISSSGLAKSKLGKAVKLDKVNGRQVIGGTVTAVVVYGPDILRACSGKISGKQLIKNSTVNTAGLVGAAIGTAIPIPVVGSMIGGAVGSFVAKKIMDNFIEDDAVVMFKIMREEFLDIVMLYSFNKEEFGEIVSATIGNSEMSKVLQAMYQSGTPKDYADALINAEVQSVLSKREKITRDKIEQGMQLLLDDKTVA